MVTSLAFSLASLRPQCSTWLLTLPQASGTAAPASSALATPQAALNERRRASRRQQLAGGCDGEDVDHAAGLAQALTRVGRRRTWLFRRSGPRVPLPRLTARVG